MTREDPHAAITATLDQLDREVAAATAGDLRRPTPCGEFDVGTVSAHVVGVLRRLTAVGSGEDFLGPADPATDHAADDPDADWLTTFRASRTGFDRVWAPPEQRDATFALPWASMTGRDLFEAYVAEFCVHAWDLAVVTGRVGELDPDLAVAALRWYQRYVPAEGRQADGPFAPAVAVGVDADAYDRLAGYVGRRSSTRGHWTTGNPPG